MSPRSGVLVLFLRSILSGTECRGIACIHPHGALVRMCRAKMLPQCAVEGVYS